MWNLPANSIWIFVTMAKHRILNKVKEDPRRLWRGRDRIWGWHFKTQILPLFSCKLACLQCSVSQWHQVTSHTPHSVPFKKQRETELLKYHLHMEVNKFPEGLQSWFFRQDSLPHSPNLSNRYNHIDQLCRALWELLVKKLQNWWLLRPGDSHSYRPFGPHLWADNGISHFTLHWEQEHSLHWKTNR